MAYVSQETDYCLSWLDDRDSIADNQDWLSRRNSYYTREQLEMYFSNRVVTHLNLSPNTLPLEIWQLLPNLTHLAIVAPLERLPPRLDKLECLVVTGEISDDDWIFLSTHYPQLKELHLGTSQTPIPYLTDETLELVSRLKFLERLTISSNIHNRWHLKKLPHLPQLRSLTVKATSLSPGGLSSALSLCTMLEVLELPDCWFTDYPNPGNPGISALPEDCPFPPSLKELDLSCCRLSTLPTSMSTLTDLKKLTLSANIWSNITDVLSTLSHLKRLQHLNLSGCQLSAIPLSLCNFHSLMSLDLSSNQLEDCGFLDTLDQLSNLKVFNLSTAAPLRHPNSFSLRRLTGPATLESLNVSANRLPTSEFPDFALLTNLKEINLSANRLTHLPDSISQLTRLEVLKLDGNNLEAGLSEVIGSLKSLQELILTRCQLTTLPESISQLTRLEVLKLDYNNLEAGLSEVIGSLKSLQELTLTRCQLTTLPESLGNLTKLEYLDLSHNRIFDSLNIIARLVALKSLNLDSCELVDLPNSFRHLVNLESLDMKYGRFSDLPQCVGKLSSLRDLDLMNSSTLRSLHQNIISLKHLANFDISGCPSLISPPAAAIRSTQNTLSAIRQYYNDEARRVESRQSSVAVTVIGSSGAGKTSLIRTLQSKARERVLTGATGESTKVFNFEEVSLANSAKTTLRFIDLGGQEIYHSAYHLTFRKNCLVVVVVNMKQYQELKCQFGEKEAVRRSYFDWLAHLYLAEPTLAPPKLVLTHKDEFCEEEFQGLKENLTTTFSILRNEILDEEKCANAQSLAFHNFRNVNLPLFCVSDVFEVGKEKDYDVFDNLKISLSQACSKYFEETPKDSATITNAICELDGCFLDQAKTFDELCKTFSLENPQLENILAYMHDCGRLLWYKDIASLSQIVFHKISTVTGLIKVLYDHEVRGKPKAENSALSRHGSLGSENSRDVDQDFRSSGIIDKGLLEKLIRAESDFKTRSQVDTAIVLLRSFNLLHGPIKLDSRGARFLLPYYFQGYMDSFTPPIGHLMFRVQLQFGGYALPLTAFYTMIPTFLTRFVRPEDTVAVKKNGVQVVSAISDFRATFLHDKNCQIATIALSDEADAIDGLWMQLEKFTNVIIKEVAATWKATRIKCIFYCPHCLLTSKAHPQKETNPSWCDLSPRLSRPLNGTKRIRCGDDNGVLSCLCHPCLPLDDSGKTMLRRYIITVSNSAKGVQCSEEIDTEADRMPEVEDDEESDISDGEDYLYGRGGDRGVYMERIPLAPCTKRQIKDLYINTDKVYKMSSPLRGRALIINNKSFSVRGYETREGSDVDVQNLRDLFDGLQFESDAKIDLTAEEMKSVIHEETEKEEHEDYGMFVLAIMSHGGEDNRISGTDGQVIKLSEVSDLLSAQNFPQMRGKPKFIIVQACSGGRRDVGVQLPIASSTGGSRMSLSTDAPSVPTDNTGVLNTDDFVFFKSSFETYASLRHERGGSLFIRCLVATFKKHASHRDTSSLCEIVRKRVREGSEKLLREAPQEATGQNPIFYQTLTSGRKIYFFPGVGREQSSGS